MILINTQCAPAEPYITCVMLKCGPVPAVNYGYRKCAIHIKPSCVCVQQSLMTAIDESHIIHLIPMRSRSLAHRTRREE